MTKFIIELSNVSNEYVSSKAIDAADVDEAIEVAEGFMRSKGAHIARIFRRRGSLTACVTEDGEICKASWLRGR